MQYGFVLPGGTATQQLELAVIAEAAGWDGVFVWEAAYGVDAWSLLAAMAQRTERIRLGTMLTPLPWRRPWKVASQAATLDQLSGGRAILAVGLGAVTTGLARTGEVTDRRTRAEMLDEGLDIMQGLWAGRRRFEGRHYRMDLEERDDLGRAAQPVQPRIPIWVVGAWPRPKSMQRVLRCDGVLPAVIDAEGPRETTPEDIEAMRHWLDDHLDEDRSAGFDIVMEGVTPAGDRAHDIVAPWVAAGCTWWIEARWELPHDSAERMREVRERLEAGRREHRLSACRRGVGYDTAMVAAGWLLIAGLAVFLTGAAFWKPAVYEQSLSEALTAMAADRRRLRWVYVWMIAGVVTSTAAVFVLAAELAGTGRFFAPAAAAMFALGGALWMVALCFHLTVGEWAAVETARTGATPDGYESLRHWADSLYAVHMLLGYAAAGLLGAALLAAEVTPRWFGWAEVALGAGCALGFAALRGGPFSPPVLVYVLTGAIAVALIFSA